MNVSSTYAAAHVKVSRKK